MPVDWLSKRLTRVRDHQAYPGFSCLLGAKGIFDDSVKAQSLTVLEPKVVAPWHIANMPKRISESLALCVIKGVLSGVSLNPTLTLGSGNKPHSHTPCPG